MMEMDFLKELLKDILKKSFFKFIKLTSFTRRYQFEDRSNNSDTLCMILAGYKEFTWDIVFKRIKEFSDENMDICIVCSGWYSERLSKIVKDNDWSYIVNKRNTIIFINNLA